MNYISTRGAAPAVGFIDCLLAGLAPDGGLYVPEAWPVVAPEEIAGFATAPYAEVAADILGRFAGDEIASEVVTRLCAEAYAEFDHTAVTPLRQLDPGCFLLELFHGPTLAFKDVAMQLLARLYDHILAQQGRTMTIVCATSGDTGGSAVEAFRGRVNIKLVVLFPDGRISDVQRRFITTADEDNVRAVAVAGDFDDCQSILKILFADAPFARAVGLAAVNSINFARIAAQSVYYFVAAAALGAPQRRVTFAVPTGNFGDAFAGFAAHAMGLPIARILVATNANAIVARAIETGRYARGAGVATQSPAMDIQVASNFERLYFECAGRDGERTARAFAAVAALGATDIPSVALQTMRALFCGVSVSEAQTAMAMRAAHERTGEFIDPHTAVALSGAESRAADPSWSPMIVLSTAHPAKFAEAVSAATGRTPPFPRAAREVAGRPERIERLPASAEAVKAYVRAFATR